MINKHELRIGNLINTKHGVQKIDSIGMSDCSSILPLCHFSLRRFNYNDINPIPLTEDWLLKFGFKQLDDPFSGIFIYNDNIPIGKFSDYDKSTFYERVYYFTSTLHNGAGTIVVKLDYVHQLQNYIFSLSGQELTLKP